MIITVFIFTNSPYLAMVDDIILLKIIKLTVCIVDIGNLRNTGLNLKNIFMWVNLLFNSIGYIKIYY